MTGLHVSARFDDTHSPGYRSYSLSEIESGSSSGAEYLSKCQLRLESVGQQARFGRPLVEREDSREPQVRKMGVQSW